MAHPQHAHGQQQHQQQQQQQGGWAPPPPRGGSGGGGGKALPIAIGAGLAVGVFVGLLLIRGTGSAEAESSDGVASNSDTKTEAIDAGVVATLATPDAQMIAQIDAAPAKPVIPTATLTFAVLPADAEGLEITINGEKLEGNSFSTELPKGTAKKLTIKATAKGHRSFRHKLTLEKDETIEIALKPRKRSGGTSTRPPKPPKTGPGGLIDL